MPVKALGDYNRDFLYACPFEEPPVTWGERGLTNIAIIKRLHELLSALSEGGYEIRMGGDVNFKAGVMEADG